jgi:amino acid adenylation domain-containing protein
MLSDTERRQLLESWNPPPSPYPETLCAQQLFEAQVGRTPDASALIYEGVSLSYHELNERANQLGHRLQALGVGPDVRVVLSMERSVELLVALLAVLKAGGCYVPVDPGYPPDRIRLMVSEARPKVIVTQQDLEDRFAGAHAQVVVADRGWGEEAVSNPMPDVRNPDRLAYVIFTSGSTGRPKGVAMPHRPLVNLVHWQIGRSGLGPGHRTLQFASVSFDVHFQELFATWGCGGTVVLASEALRRDPATMVERLATWRIHRLFLPYVALQHLADAALERPDLRWELREVVTAGEALVITPQLRGWFERMEGCVLENQYGPSETHVATAFRLQGPPSDWKALPPIGRPVANSVAHVVSPGTREPAPVGVPGELLLGGVCLARGYLDQPEFTRERFIPSPFAEGERLYRTGDLARWLPEGELEFLGRADHQVKIRGFRVELGEVETVLAEAPGVKESVVVAQEQGRTRRLVAYVVSQPGVEWSASDLREFLGTRVPDYMVPSLFVPLAKLPLLPSGKVNRRALPAPEGSQPRNEASFVAPEGDLEQTIAAVWREVLGVDRVGGNDNFFDLGGHSLLVVAVQSRLNAVLKRSVPVVDLFRHPTISSLARALGTGGAGGLELRSIQDRARRQRDALARRKPGSAR